MNMFRIWRLLVFLFVLSGIAIVWLHVIRTFRNYMHINESTLSTKEQEIPVHVDQIILMKDKLTFADNMSTYDGIKKDMNIADAENLFHKYVSQVEVVCPDSRSIRDSGDGSWSICLYGLYNIKAPCLVYSFGVRDDWTFNDEIVSAFNCTVRAFDPSLAVEDHRRGNMIWFYRQGLSDIDGMNDNQRPIKTFMSFREAFAESQSVIDLLRIDIEGNEWNPLDAILMTKTLSTVKQIAIEFHTDEYPGGVMGKLTSVERFIFFADILRRLREAGFYRWYVKPNPWGKFLSLRGMSDLTCCYEMVLLNVNFPVS